MAKSDVGETPAKARTLTMTCRAAPAQWEGHLDDGRMFYVRVRRGELEVRLSPEPTSDVMDAVRAAPSLEVQLADPLESFMEEETMRSVTASVLDFAGVGPAALGRDV